MTEFAEQRRMMVDTQVRPSDVTKFPIIDAMLSVERADFVPVARRGTAYADGPVDLGQGRSLLEPRVLAKMLDALDLQPTEFVLTVGAGLGYTAALLARLTEAVVAVEEDSGLAEEAQRLLSDANADNVAIVDGSLAEGAAQMGPFDVVLVDGAVEAIPTALTQQVKNGGRIAAIFMEGALGVCRIGYKSDDGITWRDAFNATAEILPGFFHARSFQL